MENYIKIAILGCGRVANHYRKIFDSGVLKHWSIVGVCDIDPTRSAPFSEHFKAPSFLDYEEMLSVVDVDLLLILTPSGLHYSHSKYALELGIHVLVEKPATMLPDQARELSRLAERNSCLYGVAFQNRLNPAIQYLKKAIDHERFGKIVTATIRVRWCRYQEYFEDGWHGTWAEDGGVINQQAIHHVDALNWLFGPIETVVATTARRINRLEAEDTIVALVKFVGGALGTIEATTAARPDDIEASLSVVGERGTAIIGGVALNQIEYWRFVDKDLDDDKAPKLYSQMVPNGYGLSHGPLLQKIIDALLAGEIEAPISVRNSISTYELVHALYKSDETGGWIRLSDGNLSDRLGKSSKSWEINNGRK